MQVRERSPEGGQRADLLTHRSSGTNARERRVQKQSRALSTTVLAWSAGFFLGISSCRCRHFEGLYKLLKYVHHRTKSGGSHCLLVLSSPWSGCRLHGEASDWRLLLSWCPASVAHVSSPLPYCPLSPPHPASCGHDTSLLRAGCVRCYTLLISRCLTSFLLVALALPILELCPS